MSGVDYIEISTPGTSNLAWWSLIWRNGLVKTIQSFASWWRILWWRITAVTIWLVNEVNFALEQVLICQKKALIIICCQPPNSGISHQFANLKIMPIYIYIYIYMLFEYWSLIFFHNQISNDIDLKASLKVNHDKFTRQNQSAFKLPLVKTEKGKQSMFYFSAQLCNLLTWGFIDYPTRAFGGGVAACLWDEDRCAVHWAPPWCSISTAKLEFFYSKPGSIITYWHSWSTLDVDHWYKGGFRCH